MVKQPLIVDNKVTHIAHLVQHRLFKLRDINRIKFGVNCREVYGDFS